MTRVLSLDERLAMDRKITGLNRLWDAAQQRPNPMTVMLNIANMPPGSDGRLHVPRVEAFKDDWCKYYVSDEDLQRNPLVAELMGRQKSDFSYSNEMKVWVFMPNLPNTTGDLPSTVFIPGGEDGTKESSNTR